MGGFKCHIFQRVCDHVEPPGRFCEGSQAVREVDFYYQPAYIHPLLEILSHLSGSFLSRRCFKTSRVCNERKLDCICTLKKIYFLYLCLTSILTNSYLQKFCILTSGPSLIIRVVRFIAIRALKITYFLLLQYKESEMFCSA